MNFKSKKAYKGVNILLLGMHGYKSPYWLTYIQMQEFGGKIIKGSKGQKIIFSKMQKYEDKEGNEINTHIYRYSTVFNLDCIEGIECPYVGQYEIEEREIEYIENCENVLTQLKATNKIPDILLHDRMVACYMPLEDKIYTCKQEVFISDVEYYSTLFHEITHSTGHKKRLDRTLNTNKRSPSYAKEELIAEIGACFLCGITGIQTATIDNSVAYIQSWITRLTSDKKLVISAASQAEKAIKYLDVELIKTEVL